jgi:MYND finger
MEYCCRTGKKDEKYLPKLLKTCAKCKTQLYCSRERQKEDWKRHKITCYITSGTERPIAFAITGWGVCSGAPNSTWSVRTGKDDFKKIAENAATLFSTADSDAFLIQSGGFFNIDGTGVC